MSIWVSGWLCIQGACWPVKAAIFCVPSKRNSFTHTTTLRSTPITALFVSSLSCGTKSNAFEKSIIYVMRVSNCGPYTTRCTHLFATPSLWVEMIAVSHELGRKVTSIQVASCGAAPSSRQLAVQIMETFNIRKLSVSESMTCSF